MFVVRDTAVNSVFNGALFGVFTPEMFMSLFDLLDEIGNAALEFGYGKIFPSEVGIVGSCAHMF